MKKKFAVFGNPIKQSLSPQIHQHFAQQHQLEINYERQLSEQHRFNQDIEEFFKTGGNGCNITAPFKQMAFSLCGALSEQATRAQSVNTLARDSSDKLTGHNTDGVGLLKDLTANLHLQLSGANIMVLGAGGATRGILQPLIEQRPASLTIINRTIEKAQILAEEFADLLQINTASTSDITDNLPRPDLLLNATSAGLDGKLPITDTSFITKDCCCYDLSYASKPTSFMTLCSDAGCSQVYDGRGMLVEQAAQAFTIWTSKEVDTKTLINDFDQLNQA